MKYTLLISIIAIFCLGSVFNTNTVGVMGWTDRGWRSVEADLTQSMVSVDYAHHQIHEGESFTAYYSTTTANSNDVRSAVYIKTPAAAEVHLIASFSSSASANYYVLESPTIAANVGTAANVIYNRSRDSFKVN